jgi:hypothetical protein
MPAERRRSGRASLPAPASPSAATASGASVGAALTSPAQAPGVEQTADRLRSILSPPKGAGSEASPNAGRRLQFNDSIEARTFAIGDRASPGAPAGRRVSQPSPAAKRKSGEAAAASDSSAPVASGSQAADSPSAQPSRPKRTRFSDPRPQSLQRLADASRGVLPTPPPSEPSTSSATIGKKTSVSPPALPTPSASTTSEHAEDGAQAFRAAATAESDDDLSSVGSTSEDDCKARRRPRQKKGRKTVAKAPATSRFKPPLASYVKRLALPEPVGPAAAKVYLVEGLFTNRSVDTRFPGFPNGIDKTGKPAPYKPAALAAVLNNAEGKPVTAAVGEKPAKARPSKAWVTILPDGTQIEGKLPRHADAQSSATPQPEEKPAVNAKAVKRKGAGRYVWVTELPDGTMVDGRLPIPKGEDSDKSDVPAAEEEEVEDAILATAGSDQDEEDESPIVPRATRSRSGRTSLPAPAKTPAADLTFQPFSGLRRSRSSRSGPAASTDVGSPAPSELIEVAHRRRGKASARNSEDAETAPGVVESRFVFPLPTTFRDAPDILTDSRPFQLTYDIVWEWENGGLEQQKKPKPFKTITKSTLATDRIRSRRQSGADLQYHSADVFPDRARDLAIASICDCKPPPPESNEMGCGDTCINRALQYLCSPKTCPCGEMCSNKSLFKRLTPNLKVFWVRQPTPPPLKACSLIVGSPFPLRPAREALASRPWRTSPGASLCLTTAARWAVYLLLSTPRRPADLICPPAARSSGHHARRVLRAHSDRLQGPPGLLRSRVWRGRGP